MRDKIKDEKYFREYISQQETRISKFSDKLKGGEIKDDNIFPIQQKIYSLKYSIFEAKYSIGENLDVLKSEFTNLVYSMPQFWESKSGYIDMLWMLSLAIMFEVDEKEWNILSKLIYTNDMYDWLLGYLLSFRDGNSIYHDWKVKMENPYGYLKNIIENSSNKEKDIKNYLDNKWYIAHNEMAWYDVHKHKDKLYSGYWSFESGAIAKILRIDDEELKQQQYYPYDLVHFMD